MNCIEYEKVYAMRDGRLDGLAGHFFGLTADMREYSRLMVNYTFYFIKNILAYKLMRISVEHTGLTDRHKDTVDRFKRCIEYMAEESRAAIAEELISDERIFLARLGEEGALAFHNRIFIIIDNMLYNRIYAVFVECAEIIGSERASKEFVDFHRMYVNAAKAYRTETFESWLTELSLSADAFLRELSGGLSLIADMLTDEYDVKKTGYRIRKNAANNVLMADELSAAFNKIISFYDSNAEHLSACRDIEIIKGIYDTIAIKKESLTEGKSVYLEATESAFAEYSDNCPKLSGAEMSLMTDGIYKLLLSAAERITVTSFADMLFNMVSSSEHFCAYTDTLSKYSDRMCEVFKKTDITYKKESLLYEITTYAEIMNYSVPRLNDAEDGAEGDFVRLCRDVSSEISVIIQKNGITPIIPSPRDVFNGKEHEVLIAEENSGLNRGEIIKVLNPGYKLGETVLIRANVIAAR